MIWFLVSFGCGILWVDELDQYTLPGSGIKLGFWFAQQGSIYVFVTLIAIYMIVMNQLDKQLLSDLRAPEDFEKLDSTEQKGDRK